MPELLEQHDWIMIGPHRIRLLSRRRRPIQQTERGLSEFWAEAGEYPS